MRPAPTQWELDWSVRNILLWTVLVSPFLLAMHFVKLLVKDNFERKLCA